MTKRLFEIIGETFGVEPSRISDETSQENMEKWDSLNSVLLIDQLEREYDVKFSIEEIIGISKVSDIRDILKKHGVAVEKI